jgi:small subunit ribosomal protein S8
LQEGYIGGFKTVEDGKQNVIQVTLKYLSDRQPVVKGIRRVSRPSLRVYVGSGEIRPVRSGLGISILSTSQGVMTGKQARASKVGGEVLCEIW